MEESILNTIKKMLGIPEDDTAFDTDIIVNINAALMTLNQLGVGPTTVYEITDDTATWGDLLEDPTMYSGTKTFIYLSVKLVFDPPSASFVIDALHRQLQEVTWRLTTQVPIPEEVIVDPEEV